ncbi:thrombospondin type 1 domain-containing protein [Ditylenchus destructor]|nr:thrombospondin type 1 domain-containing protein [Ditylenchus destructor]
MNYLLPLFGLFNLLLLVLSEKSVCEYKEATISSDTLFYYQRIELTDVVDCVERCIENAEYCKAVVFTEDMDSAKGGKPRRHFCQFYSSNSEELGRPIKVNAKTPGESWLFEILDKCPFRTRGSESVVERISASAKRALKLISAQPAESQGHRKVVKTIKSSSDFTVAEGRQRMMDDTQDRQRDSKEEDKKMTFEKLSHRSHFDESSFDRESSGSHRSKYNSGENAQPAKEDLEGSFTASGHRRKVSLDEGSENAVSHNDAGDSVPIRPVSVSHGGAYSSSYSAAGGYATGPCPNGICTGGASRTSNQFSSYPQSVRGTYTNGNDKGAPCPGRPGTSDPCAPPRPPPSWSEWSNAGQCSVTCGKGVRQRKRFCSGPKEGDCKGESVKEEPCEMAECNVWTEWSEWSRCTASCGGGQKTRERTCRNGHECSGPSTETRGCNLQACPKWGPWAAWTECSRTCGKGIKQRERECTPKGEFCSEGYSSEEKSCEERPCPEWGSWEQWTECSKSCGGGERIRTRECQNGRPGECRGPGDEHLVCNTHDCPGWTDWSPWSQCSVTCGDEGSRLRQRECRYQGRVSTECPGPAQDQTACQLEACAKWASWSSWSACTTTCGHGQQMRKRECEPRGFGCSGGDREIRFCQLAVCPYYDQWSEWGGCSVTCGLGTCERRRRCHKNDPLPGAVLPTEEELGGSATGGGGALEPLDGTADSKEPEEEEDNGRKGSAAGRGKNAGRGQNAGDGSNEEEKEALKDRLIERAKSKNTGEAGQERRPRLREHTLEVAQSSSTLLVDRRRAPIKAKTTDDEQSSNDSGDCAGPDFERKQCDAGPCCEWSSWENWGQCQMRCGEGTRTRTRTCAIQPQSYSSSPSSGSGGNSRAIVPYNNRQPRQAFLQNRYGWQPTYSMPQNRFNQYLPGGGGSTACNCPGNARESESCSVAVAPISNDKNCPVSASGSSFGSSPRSEDQRSSEYQTGPPVHPKDGSTAGSGLTECFWGVWGKWRECTGSCEKANRSRERDCIRHATNCDCLGENIENQSCKLEGCESKKGERNTDVLPAHEGDSLKLLSEGDDLELNHRDAKRSDTGTMDDDPVLSCYWSEWTPWGQCGMDGLKQRTRLCVGLKALINGCECMGSSMEQTSCTFDKIQIRPQLSPRRPQQSVNVVATDEIVTLSPNLVPKAPKSLPLIAPERQHFDQVLPASSKEEKCDWSEWSEWSQCTALDCGVEGERYRSRTCPCGSCEGGITQESEGCFRTDCPV